MTKLSTHPFLLGFEEFDRLVQRTARSGNGAPPYNIEQRGADAWRIIVAVAGYGRDDLTITLENGHLVVRGDTERQPGGDVPERVFLHRGIGTGKFQRSFVLASRVEVASAGLDRGLLTIDLIRRQPETKVQRISIGSSESKEKRHG